MSMSYDIGKQSRHGMITQLYLVMTFDKFDPNNPLRCIFKQNSTRRGHEYTNVSSQSMSNSLYTWADLVEDYIHDPLIFEGRAQEPWHTVSLSGQANDTLLPHVKLDPSPEVSFEWHGMFDCFFKEAAEQKRRTTLWTEDFNDAFFAGMHHRLHPHAAVTSPRRAALFNMHMMVRRERVTKLLDCADSISDWKDVDYGVETEALQRIMDHVDETGVLGDLNGTVLSSNSTGRRRSYR
ncbi:hypothetical protein LTR56_011295 [Elasticomyces elasticus]|nr:hypothetical protein LTR56_011295 [Elasticomyces elasticus]KAK3668368.1 hypothetical protein LTR22_000659 [Elasticomyces elasticus]KAK4930942.1 hypothetical protein LTR49_002709 [Elasticomyces elasticus]KAK5758646.1 hypothetical protein LTS12_011191 [Elasticomyces elasticus]